MGQEANISTIIAEKRDCKLKPTRRDKEGHFILTKGTANQDDITILNIYISNSEAPNFIKKSIIGFRDTD